MSENFKRRMDSYFDGFNNEIGTDRDLTLEEIINYSSKCFMEKWKTSYDYRKVNPKEYKSASLAPRLLSDINFRANIAYLECLFDYLLHGKTYDIEDWVIKECEEWEIKGGNCIYFSTLLYSLLAADKMGCSDCVKYVQGFYRHNIREDYPSFFPWSGQHNGIHAWITVDNAVIDVAIRQQEYFFDFKGNPVVLGTIPDGLFYMGYEENRDTVSQYIKDILEFSKMPFLLWVKKHKLNALKTTIRFMEDMEKELTKKGDDNNDSK